MSKLALLSQIQDALVEATKPTRETTVAGGFAIMLTPDDPLVWINYAVPLASNVSVAEMEAVFRASDRVPRLEFFVDLWPEVVPALEAAGFECEKRMPIMVLERSAWRGLVHEHDVRPVDASTFHAVNHAVRSAFGAVGEPDSGDPMENGEFQRILAGWTLAAGAFVDGVAVGGGYGVGNRKVREIAGIGTLAEYRKRGIASAVIADLLDRFFGDGGDIAWLTPGDDTAQSVYANLGFVPVAAQVCYSKR